MFFILIHICSCHEQTFLPSHIIAYATSFRISSQHSDYAAYIFYCFYPVFISQAINHIKIAVVKSSVHLHLFSADYESGPRLFPSVLALVPRSSTVFTAIVRSPSSVMSCPWILSVAFWQASTLPLLRRCLMLTF